MTKAIFFDLDGTLLDTARDFAFAINLLLKRMNKPPLNFDLFRKEVHGESKRMISFAFDRQETHPEFEKIREEFLHTYHQNCTKHTIFFPGIELLLNSLDEQGIPWGIVTSKPIWLTEPITKHFGLDQRAACIVMGDTIPKKKPDPAPLVYACERVIIMPKNAVYVGDLQTDIIAAKAAGMKSVAVTYGYHPPATNFFDWDPDLIAQSPEEISQFIGL